MQAVRAKAKALVENKKTGSTIGNQILTNQKQKLDPNLFTCKYCNGSVDQATQKFVHENFCLVGNSSQMPKPQ